MTGQTGESSFEIVRRGYDPPQVEGRLRKDQEEIDRLGRRVRELEDEIADRDERSRAHEADLAGLRAERDGLHEQVEKLSIVPNSVDGMSERLEYLVRAAHEEAGEARSRATASAGKILELARGEAAELVDRARAEEAAVRAQIVDSRGELQRIKQDAHAQEAALTKHMAERRAAEEAAIRSAVEKIRAELHRRLKEFDEEQRAEAVRIVQAASQEARGRLAAAAAEAHDVRAEARNDVATAYAEVTAARQLQQEVAAQLTVLRELLDSGLPEINAVAAANAELQAGSGGEDTADINGQHDQEPAEGESAQEVPAPVNSSS